MSIKDKIEAVRVAEKERKAAEENRKERDLEEPKRFFAPVYIAFLEIAKEYESGRGLVIEATEYRCAIWKEESCNSLELSCSRIRKDKILILEMIDLHIPDTETEIEKEIAETEIMERAEELHRAKEEGCSDGYSVVFQTPDVVERAKELDSAEEAIEIAIEYIGKNIE